MAQTTKRAWKLQDFPAHSANVNCASLGHKSGRVLVTGASDKKVNLWAVGKPNCIMSLSGHSTHVDCVRFSINEEQVCAGSATGALKIWDLESAKILRTLTGHRASIKCVDFHPYGDFLASGSSDSGIKLWDIRKKGCIFGYKGHNGTVNSLKFSPDGQWIASGGDDNYVKVWDIRVGKVLTEFGDHRGPVTDVEFHPHEFVLASGSLDRTVKFWELESFSQISSSLADAPPVKSITFHPNGDCLFAASQETLRVHGWEPPECHDSVPTTWSKIQDIVVSHEQLVGVSMQMTNVAIFIVDLRRVHPIGNSKHTRAALSSGHSLRKSFNKERSDEFAESLNAMKANEESDSLPTDPEDESNVPYVSNNFREVFRPQRDLARTPPPEEFFPPPDEEAASSTSIESMSPRLEPITSGRHPAKFRFVTTRPPHPTKHRTPDTSPRRSSVPNFVPGQLIQNHLGGGVGSNRSRSPEYLSSRQSSLSDDSSGPYSGRSTDTRSSCGDSLYSQAPLSSRRDQVRNGLPDTSMMMPPSKGEVQQPAAPQAPSRDKLYVQQSYSQAQTAPLQPLPRSPERPLAQCQVKPMPKAVPTPRECIGSNNEDYFQKKTDFNNHYSSKAQQEDDIVPMRIDRPTGLAIDDFLPKKSAMGFNGGMQVLDMSEIDVISNLNKEHQPLMRVFAVRQRNLRDTFSIWQRKDVKTALEYAVSLNDDTVIVDLLSVLALRPSIWNLDLCVCLLPSILQLLQSRYEAYMNTGCDALRLIMKNFASVIKTNIESPIQTVGVDISREERYNKSMECYRHLVGIRNFTLKRQTLQGKIGHTFRELHILLSNLD